MAFLDSWNLGILGLWTVLEYLESWNLGFLASVLMGDIGFLESWILAYSSAHLDYGIPHVSLILIDVLLLIAILES